MSSESIALSGTLTTPRPLLDKVSGWLTTVDHKRLAILYILFALAFLAIGGIEATIMRIQLRTGVTRDGSQLDPMMPYLTAYRDMTDQDAKDVVRFLRTVEPAKRSWPSSQ